MMCGPSSFWLTTPVLCGMWWTWIYASTYQHSILQHLNILNEIIFLGIFFMQRKALHCSVSFNRATVCFLLPSVVLQSILSHSNRSCSIWRAVQTWPTTDSVESESGPVAQSQVSRSQCQRCSKVKIHTKGFK